MDANPTTPDLRVRKDPFVHASKVRRFHRTCLVGDRIEFDPAGEIDLVEADVGPGIVATRNIGHRKQRALGQRWCCVNPKIALRASTQSPGASGIVLLQQIWYCCSVGD